MYIFISRKNFTSEIFESTNDSDDYENIPEKKSKNNGAKKKPSSIRFRWNSEMIEALLNSLNELKCQYQFKGLDFENDLIKTYHEVRVLMAKKYMNGEFGPVEVTEIDTDLPPEELASIKAKSYEEKKAVKIGYDRIKTKIKEVRQDYRKAVNERRRSGSGKLVCDNWDLLKTLWGGSPATESIINSQATLRVAGDEDDLESNGYESPEESENENDEMQSTSKNKQENPSNLTAKYVDNKRKLMEKNLSVNQRDQIYLNLAKDELKLKQNLVEDLAEATRESNKAFTQISDSIKSVGNSIGNGLALLAQALAGPQQSQYFNPNMRYNAGIESPLHSTFYSNQAQPPSSFTNYISGQDFNNSSRSGSNESYDSSRNKTYENEKIYENL